MNQLPEFCKAVPVARQETLNGGITSIIGIRRNGFDQTDPLIQCSIQERVVRPDFAVNRGVAC